METRARPGPSSRSTWEAPKAAPYPWTAPLTVGRLCQSERTVQMEGRWAEKVLAL